MKRFFEHHCTLSNTMTTTLMDRWTEVLRAEEPLYTPQCECYDPCKTLTNSRQAFKEWAPMGRLCCQNNHDMLRTARSFYPTCGGSSTAMEWGTAANVLYACLILMGNSLQVSGDGARGCTEGLNAKESRIEGSEG